MVYNQNTLSPKLPQINAVVTRQQEAQVAEQERADDKASLSMPTDLSSKMKH